MAAAMTHRKTGTQGGVIGLLAGGLVLIAMVWAFAFLLSGSLSQVHMRHKAQGVIGQASMILREAGETLKAPLKAATRAELRRLMKYREVARMDIADGAGRVLWSSASGAAAGRIAAPAGRMDMRLYKTGNAELQRTFSRATAAIGSPRGLVSLDIDVTGMLAWYRRISFMVAKAITTVLLAGFLVMGIMLFGKYRERQEARNALEALRRENAIEQEKARALQAQLDELNAALARFNRKLGSAMKDNDGESCGKAEKASRARKTG